MNATEIKEEILSWLPNVPVPLTGCAIPSSSERGVVTGIMNTSLRMIADMGTANIRRRMVLAWIFREALNKPMRVEISAKELTDEMWWCLCKYVEAHKDQDTGAWHGKEGLQEELHVCLKAMESWENDMNKQLGFLEEK